MNLYSRLSDLIGEQKTKTATHIVHGTKELARQLSERSGDEYKQITDMGRLSININLQKHTWD